MLSPPTSGNERKHSLVQQKKRSTIASPHHRPLHTSRSYTDTLRSSAYSPTVDSNYLFADYFRSREPARTDVWPEAKIASEIEERFLRLPDSDDYTRVRQFNIDAKGAVVSRGDSFRRKKDKRQSGKQ